MRGAPSALAAADQLCGACVDLLEVDGAAISLVHQGVTRGTFGSSGEMSRRLDELQFTYGEGPCLDSVRHRAPVLVPDLADVSEQRWPGFRDAVLGQGVSAVFALPVSVANTPIGALDLFCHRPGALTEHGLRGGLLAAELAALPLLELMQSDLDLDHPNESEERGPAAGAWDQLASLERVEIYQATGMVMGASGVSVAEALIRLRACAFVRGITARDVAVMVVDRQLVPQPDGGWLEAGGTDDR